MTYGTQGQESSWVSGEGGTGNVGALSPSPVCSFLCFCSGRSLCTRTSSASQLTCWVKVATRVSWGHVLLFCPLVNLTSSLSVTGTHRQQEWESPESNMAARNQAHILEEMCWAERTTSWEHHSHGSRWPPEWWHPLLYWESVCVYINIQFTILKRSFTLLGVKSFDSAGQFYGK